jgi:general secretion pathway protein G
MKKAFTMIELVFVIVILGILAAIAIPKMGDTTTKAEIAKAKADVSAIRSAILTERQSQLIKGINSYIPKLSDNDEVLFTGDGTRKLLTYGIASGTESGKWSADDNEYKNYTFHIDSQSVAFTYDSDTGIFTCDRTDGDICKKLID